MAGRRERIGKWGRRAVVLAAVGVLVQVGFVVWRVWTNPATVAAVWVFQVETESGERTVLVKEYFGATECLTSAVALMEDGVIAYDASGLHMRTAWRQLGDSDPPGWYGAWSDGELLGFVEWLERERGVAEMPLFVSIARLGFGFPFRSFSGDRLYNGMLDRGINSMLTPNGAAYSPGFVRFGSWELPLRPIWSGLLLNVAMVVAAGLLVLGGWDWWRWHRRVREGQCPGCGYDLAGVPDGVPCPECGREPR